MLAFCSLSARYIAGRPATTQLRQDSVNPPHNLPKENLTTEERERRIKEANRQYFKAAGDMEGFYEAYPYERPPERERQPQLKRQHEAEADHKRERGGRGGR